MSNRINICPSCKNPATESSDYLAAVYYKGLSNFTCEKCGFKGPMISVTKEEYVKIADTKLNKKK